MEALNLNASSVSDKRSVVHERLSTLVDNLVEDDLHQRRIEAMRAMAEELRCLEAKERMHLLLLFFGDVLDLGFLSSTKLRHLSPWAQALYDACQVNTCMRQANNVSFSQYTEFTLPLKKQDGSNIVFRFVGDYSNRDLKNGDKNSLSGLFSDDESENEDSEDVSYDDFSDDEDDDYDYDDYEDVTGNARLLGRRARGSHNQGPRIDWQAENEGAPSTTNMTEQSVEGSTSNAHTNEETQGERERRHYEEAMEDYRIYQLRAGLGELDGQSNDNDQNSDRGSHFDSGDYIFDENDHDEEHSDNGDDGNDDSIEEEESETSDDDESHIGNRNEEGRTRVDFFLKVQLPGELEPRKLLSLQFTTCSNHYWDPVLYEKEDEEDGDEDSIEEKSEQNEDDRLMEDPDFYKDFERTGTRNAYGKEKRITEFHRSREQRLLWALEGRPPAKATETEYENFFIEDECECRVCLMVHGFRAEVDWHALHTLTEAIQESFSPIPIVPRVLHWFDIRVEHPDDELFRFVRACRILAFLLTICGGSCGHSFSPMEMFFSVIVPSGVPVISGTRRLGYDDLDAASDGSLGLD